MKQHVAILGLALGACGDDGGGPVADASVAAVDAAPRQTVMESKSILSTQIVEGSLTGGKNDRAVIYLSAPRATLDWNLHGHAGGGTTTVKEELAVMTAVYDFVPSAQADWLLLLRNTDPATMSVDVKIELYGAMVWGSWQ